LALGLALLIAGCGGSTGSGSTTSGAHGHAKHTDRATAKVVVPARLVYHHLYSLPAPLRDPASAVLGPGRYALLGGLDAADTSTDEVDVGDLHGVHSSSRLPEAQHDAQGAALDGKVYVFGGGSLSELDHILSYDPGSGAVHVVGSLPHAQSDVAVTEINGIAYVFGGYDGASWLNTVIAYRPGAAPKVVGHLPVGLRYSAATPAPNGEILVIGGSTPSGATDAIYRFDPRTGGVRQIGHLPHPVTHAAAATLGATVYLVGGRGDSVDAQTAGIWAINPATGAVHGAGHLPVALSDTGVQTLGGVILVAGGQSPSGTVAGVGELAPAGAA
jgi:N-acetylneuraminic acid mutarotase